MKKISLSIKKGDLSFNDMKYISKICDELKIFNKDGELIFICKDQMIQSAESTVEADSMVFVTYKGIKNTSETQI